MGGYPCPILLDFELDRGIYMIDFSTKIHPDWTPPSKVIVLSDTYIYIYIPIYIYNILRHYVFCTLGTSKQTSSVVPGESRTSRPTVIAEFLEIR